MIPILSLLKMILLFLCSSLFCSIDTPSYFNISMSEYCSYIGPINPLRQNILTLNQYGSSYCFTTELTEDFLDYCHDHPGSRMLEIGCAYGIKSSQIVQEGVILTATDLDERHIQIAQNAFAKFSAKKSCFSNVIFLAGDIIEMDIDRFNNQKFKGVLLESVLHFTTPENLPIILNKLYELLEDKGRIYITVSAPFLKYLADAYETNKKLGIPWPGYFKNPEEIAPQNARLHKPYHAFDQETLSRELCLAGFKVIKSKYIPRPHREDDMILDGREGLMMIAEKCL